MSGAERWRKAAEEFAAACKDLEAARKALVKALKESQQRHPR